MGFLIALVTVAAGCAAPADLPQESRDSGMPAQGGSLSSEPSVTAAADTSVRRLIAVGDIADCTTGKDEKVAAVVADMRGKIATLGDTVYESGTPGEFQKCFDPQWGPMVSRMFPALGNHEYATEGAAGYFGYFSAKGRETGDVGKGWYSYNLGPSWKAIVLNSNCGRVGCTEGSEQGRWLAEELELAGDRHVLAYWHAPRYSSGRHGSSAVMKPFFRMLWRARADIVLSGHDHSYERFAPQNASGDRRPRGVQQFVVGTGGRHLYAFSDPKLPNTRARNDDTYGVLKLRLRADGYSWRFVRAAGAAFTDSGSRTLQ